MSAFMASWLGSAFVMFVIGGLFHVFIPWIDPSIEAEYRNTGLFRPWDGWTRYYMMVHPFGVSLPFTFGYILLEQSLLPTSILRGKFGGLTYGIALFILGSLPVFLLNYASFQVSTKVIVAWAAQNCIQYTSAGCFLQWMFRGTS